MKVAAAALAFALVGLVACSIGPPPMPTATASVGTMHVSLALGSYCWPVWGGSECADAADPAALLRTGYLKPIDAGPGMPVDVRFSSAPKTVDVNLLWASRQSTSPVSSTGASFDLPVAAGRYVFTITGKWAEGDVSFFLPVDVAAIPI